jgi:hypothetical protein
MQSIYWRLKAGLLGNHLADNDELENIEPLFRAHPEVLECRLQIFIAVKQWDAALTVAETLTEQMQGRPAAWVAMAECLHQKATQNLPIRR